MMGVPSLVRWCVVVLLPCACVAVTFDEKLLVSAPVEEERECHGTSVGFGYSGTLELHYQNMRKRYGGCTYVHGNLEVTNLDDPDIAYDLAFLSSIKYVSGYVLIGLSTQVEKIPLLSLELIRGNQTYRIQGEEYALVVALTSRDTIPIMGLRHLHLPKLKEISRGKVMFSQNPLLSYMTTVAWDIITRGREDSLHVADKAFSMDEVTCPDVCRTSSGLSPCWGDAPQLCQELVTGECSDICKWRCYGPGLSECCHPDCAIGCTGPGPKDCIVCMDYKLDDTCVGYCPAKTYPKMQTCVRYDNVPNE